MWGKDRGEWSEEKGEEGSVMALAWTLRFYLSSFSTTLTSSLWQENFLAMPPKGSKMVRPSMLQVEGADPTRELAFAYSTFTVPPPINAKSELNEHLKRLHLLTLLSLD
jgi:hypothetical protein